MAAQAVHATFDRSQARDKWTSLPAQYHTLVNSIPQPAFKRLTKDTRWTISEILTHMIQTLEVMPGAVASLRRGKDYMNLPLAIISASNLLLVRLMARSLTPQALIDRYDRAFDAAMQAWDAVGDDEWDKGASMFGEGYRTLAEYYQHSLDHFMEHAGQVRRTL